MKLIEKKLRASEESFRQLADAMPQIVWTARPDGFSDYFNARWYEFTGFERGEGGDPSWTPILPKEDKERCLSVWYECVRTGRPFQIEYRFWDRKTQQYRWHLGRALPVRDGQGRITRWFGTSTDIHEQKQLELDQRRFVSLIETSDDFICMTDLEGKVLYVNRAGLQMCGNPPIDNLRVSDYVDMDSWAKIRETVFPTLLQQGHWQGELTFRNSLTGEKIPVWMNSFPILDDQTGKPVAFASVSRNLSQRKLDEEERIELVGREQAALRASQIKSEFLANVSHEIRTPLNGIVGMTSLLLETPLNQEQTTFAQTIKSSADVLLYLLNDILDLSKIEAGKLGLEEIDFALGPILEHIRAVFSIVAREKGIEFSLEVDLSEALRLRGDPTRLRQVLTNLISNAVKFTDKGSVRVRISALEAKAESVRLRFEVTDTGIGISQRASRELFKSFSQGDASTARKYGGTGLGLSICKHIVELMQGRIGVESQPGCGSQFWFEVPLRRGYVALPQPVGRHSVQNVGKLRRGRILVAEDNEVNRRVLSLVLESLNQQAKCAATGKEALALFLKEEFDLVLMDCQMPEMDGYEAVRAIRALEDVRKREVPIVAVTANAFQEDRERCFHSGMNGYLSKPVKREILHAVLSRWILPEPTSASEPV